MVSTSDDNISNHTRKFTNEQDPESEDSEGEAESEIKIYLDKLKEIVPRCPKHRRVSRLELIQHVIDYICDLQHALESRTQHVEMNAALSLHQQLLPAEVYKNSGVSRQPLGALPSPENIQMLREHPHPCRQNRSTTKPTAQTSLFSLGSENG